MIVLYVSLADAESLLTLAGELPNVVQQITPQIVIERVLPVAEKPVLSYRYESELIGEDVYDAARADRMVAALRSAQTEHVEERRQQRLRKAR